MRATIDRAGRLVIPRALRARIGLAAGGEVELALDGAGVRIDPVTEGGLEEEDGFLVIPDSAPVTDEMIREMIDADRHAR
ncbi:MAG: AbrB/MazE/SpoVT family DNA-binding domain-containing protein [Chloroflexota bacterium]|nr:AbrB/MazE/SpoVT family DNA-binding domain-containing protein [Chloroflexota bacterium]